MAGKQVEKRADAQAELAGAVADQFREWALAIPEGSDQTGQLAILAQVAGAESSTALDAPWESVGGKSLLTRMIVVTALKRVPSSFAQGLGIFLVVTAADATTGEELTFTTSSVSVMGQLIRAHHMGWLPIKCMLVEAIRPTSDGYRPQHLKVYGDGDDF